MTPQPIAQGWLDIYLSEVDHAWTRTEDGSYVHGEGRDRHSIELFWEPGMPKAFFNMCRVRDEATIVFFPIDFGYSDFRIILDRMRIIFKY